MRLGQVPQNETKGAWECLQGAWETYGAAEKGAAHRGLAPAGRFRRKALRVNRQPIRNGGGA